MTSLNEHVSGQAQITRDYSPQHADAIRAASGQVVQVGRDDDEYPGWLWCTATDGLSGWVPCELLRVDGASGEFLANYDATELAVRRGEVVHVAEVRHGWMLVTNAEGACGWIPAACAAQDRDA